MGDGGKEIAGATELAAQHGFAEALDVSKRVEAKALEALDHLG
jgi:hypothetical protein